MARFSDLRTDKDLRKAFEAYLTRTKKMRVYKFAMLKTKPIDEISFLLRDVTPAEDIDLGFCGKKAKSILKEVQADIAKDEGNGPKVISDMKRLELDDRWKKNRDAAKKAALKAVDNWVASSDFDESNENKKYLHASVISDMTRLSADFSKEYDLDPKALDLFAKRKEITDKIFEDAMKKYAPKDTKKKSKTPTFKDFKAFVKRKTGVAL